MNPLKFLTPPDFPFWARATFFDFRTDDVSNPYMVMLPRQQSAPSSRPWRREMQVVGSGMMTSAVSPDMGC
jgi:hypothetical protein